MWYGGSWKALSSLNVGKRFSFAGVYELPYGTGRRFGSGTPALANAIFGGWQLSTLAEALTGVPLTVTTPGNIANSGGVTQVPNVVAKAILPRSQRTKSEFFNTAAFVAPAPYTLGDSETYIINAPSFQNLDASLAKYFKIREKMSLQFRTEVFNILNHPNWGNPGTTLGTATFGRITSNSVSGTPRTFQFGLKLLF